MRDRAKGFSLVELAVTVAIFGILLLILVSLEGQYLRFDRSVRVEFLKHPETEAVLARVRRDVLDSSSYPLGFKTFTQSSTHSHRGAVRPLGSSSDDRLPVRRRRCEAERIPR